MIRFSLRCRQGHEFEGWFRSGDAFERQAKRAEIRCPECGSTKIGKSIMAPAIAKRGTSPAAPSPAAAEPAAEAPAPKPAAAEPPAAHMNYAGRMHEALREMRRFIEKHADYVGPRFAEEARRIHHGETKQRSIYGEASDKEAEALRDEGIEFGRIPWPKQRHDA